MSEDWLDIRDPEQDNAVAEEYRAGLPAVVAIPDGYTERLALAEACWAELTLNQKTFLQTWRDCRYNARAACRKLGLSENTRPMTSGMQYPAFATVVQIWRANAAATALDKDRLLARHDDIVETLLEPKMVMNRDGNLISTSGDPNGAARANETLMQAAGILKSGKDVDVNVNVGIAVGPPTLNIQVLPQPPSKTVQRESVIVDTKFTEVPSDEWLDT